MASAAFRSGRRAREETRVRVSSRRAQGGARTNASGCVAATREMELALPECGRSAAPTRMWNPNIRCGVSPPLPRKGGTERGSSLTIPLRARKAAPGDGPAPYLVGRVHCKWIESALVYKKVGQLNAKVRPLGEGQRPGKAGKERSVLTRDQRRETRNRFLDPLAGAGRSPQERIEVSCDDSRAGRSLDSGFSRRRGGGVEEGSPSIPTNHSWRGRATRWSGWCARPPGGSVAGCRR